MTAMPAITIWQPWAGLIIRGIKPIENRAWKPPAKLLGQRIAIHAGKKYDRDAELLDRVYDAVNHGGAPQSIACHKLGAVLGTARLVGVVRWVSCGIIRTTADGTLHIDSSEVPGFEWWDHRYNQFGWLLDEVKEFDEPVPAVGHQGIWYWSPPEGLDV